MKMLNLNNQLLTISLYIFSKRCRLQNANKSEYKMYLIQIQLYVIHVLRFTQDINKKTNALRELVLFPTANQQQKNKQKKTILF